MAEENSLGDHRHQDWTIARTVNEQFPEELHWETYTCNVCGTIFIHKKNGPLPDDEG